MSSRTKPRRSLRLVGFALGLAAMAALRSADADPALLNGSFEVGAIPPGTIEPGSSGLFWSAGDVNLVADPFGNLGTTPYGNQFILMNPGPNGTDQQLVEGFLSGETYVFAFYFASIWFDFPHDAAISLTLSGAATGVFVFNGPAGLGHYGPGDIEFQLAQLTFTTIADGNVNFLISDIGTGELAVDNVTLARQVPEATSCVLLLEGMSLLVLVFAGHVLRGRRVATVAF